MHKRNERRLALFLWFLIAIPASTLVYTQALTMLWRWYLRPQYGTGPSFAAWYGVSMIVTVLTWHLARQRPRAVEDAEYGLGEAITASVTNWTTIGVAIAIAYATGAVFGWIP